MTSQNHSKKGKELCIDALRIYSDSLRKEILFFVTCIDLNAHIYIFFCIFLLFVTSKDVCLKQKQKPPEAT